MLPSSPTPKHDKKADDAPPDAPNIITTTTDAPDDSPRQDVEATTTTDAPHDSPRQDVEATTTITTTNVVTGDMGTTDHGLEMSPRHDARVLSVESLNKGSSIYSLSERRENKTKKEIPIPPPKQAIQAIPGLVRDGPPGSNNGGRGTPPRAPGILREDRSSRCNSSGSGAPQPGILGDRATPSTRSTHDPGGLGGSLFDPKGGLFTPAPEFPLTSDDDLSSDEEDDECVMSSSLSSVGSIDCCEDPEARYFGTALSTRSIRECSIYTLIQDAARGDDKGANDNINPWADPGDMSNMNNGNNSLGGGGANMNQATTQSVRNLLMRSGGACSIMSKNKNPLKRGDSVDMDKESFLSGLIAYCESPDGYGAILVSFVILFSAVRVFFLCIDADQMSLDPKAVAAGEEIQGDTWIVSEHLRHPIPARFFLNYGTHRVLHVYNYLFPIYLILESRKREYFIVGFVIVTISLLLRIPVFQETEKPDKDAHPTGTKWEAFVCASLVVEALMIMTVFPLLRWRVVKRQWKPMKGTMGHINGLAGVASVIVLWILCAVRFPYPNFAFDYVILLCCFTTTVTLLLRVYYFRPLETSFLDDGKPEGEDILASVPGADSSLLFHAAYRSAFPLSFIFLLDIGNFLGLGHFMISFLWQCTCIFGLRMVKTMYTLMVGKNHMTGFLFDVQFTINLITAFLLIYHPEPLQLKVCNYGFWLQLSLLPFWEVFRDTRLDILVRDGKTWIGSLFLSRASRRRKKSRSYTDELFFAEGIYLRCNQCAYADVLSGIIALTITTVEYICIEFKIAPQFDQVRGKIRTDMHLRILTAVIYLSVTFLSSKYIIATNLRRLQRCKRKFRHESNFIVTEDLWNRTVRASMKRPAGRKALEFRPSVDSSFSSTMMNSQSTADRSTLPYLNTPPSRTSGRTTIGAASSGPQRFSSNYGFAGGGGGSSESTPKNRASASPSAGGKSPSRRGITSVTFTELEDAGGGSTGSSAMATNDEPPEKIGSATRSNSLRSLMSYTSGRTQMISPSGRNLMVTPSGRNFKPPHTQGGIVPRTNPSTNNMINSAWPNQRSGNSKRRKEKKRIELAQFYPDQFPQSAILTVKELNVVHIMRFSFFYLLASAWVVISSYRLVPSMLRMEGSCGANLT